MHYDVVIAGGGFAGAYCAKTLGKALGAEGIKRVALVAERNVLVFQPMLAEVAGSSLVPIDVVQPLRQMCRHVDVLQGSISHIDWNARSLSLNAGRFTRDHHVGFDHLVLTLGSVTDLSRVPGMAEHGWPMKSVADALRLRAALINRLEEANLVGDADVRRRLLTFVVVGGGYTGVETAGQLFDFIHGSLRFYANLSSSHVRVLLIHSHDSLLAEIGPKLGAYAERVLKRRGIEVLLSTRVAAVTASKVRFENGDEVETHTVVSTIGNATHTVVEDLCRQIGLPLARGRVPAEPTLLVRGQTHLWTAGDCASVLWNDRGTQKIAPPTAQLALRQGRQLGLNLAKVLRASPGSKPALRPFTYRYLGQMATIGEREAVAEVLGFHFSGFIAWWMWRTVYLAKLPGLMRKLRVMVDWTFELVFPRDLSLLLPPPEDVIRFIHLEPGELLFKRGDKCRAIFYVTEGELELVSNDTPPATRTFPAGSIIDQDQLDAEGCWRDQARARTCADVAVFRGKALDLLRNDLRLKHVPKDHEALIS